MTDQSIHYYEGYCAALRDVHRMICVSNGVWDRAGKAKKKLLAMMDHILSDPDRFARSGGDVHFAFQGDNKNIKAIWEDNT